MKPVGWKDVDGFPGYQVSDMGDVRSTRCVLKKRVTNGYEYVTLYRDTKPRDGQGSRLGPDGFRRATAEGPCE